MNELAGVRVEHEAVFEATHQLIGRWLREGLVHALRLDHPDGLFDPEAYFSRLQQLARERTGQDAPLYVVAEKILSGRERLRDDWQVHGTTGYDFLNEINGLFLDPSGVRRLRRLHARTTGLREPIEEIVYDAKKLIMNTAMSSELGVLADALARIARADRHTRDFTLNSLRELITEYVACIPVYRTYVSPRGWTHEDEAIIDRTIAEAERRNPAMERSLFRFLRQVLLPEPPDDARRRQGQPSMYERRARLCHEAAAVHGPGAGQGRRGHDVLSLQRAGVDERGRRRPGAARRTRWRTCTPPTRARQRDWPAEMTTLSTHDTKLGEDVRARINALSELADDWQDALGRALRASSSARTLLRGDVGARPQRRVPLPAGAAGVLAAGPAVATPLRRPTSSRG